MLKRLPIIFILYFVGLNICSQEKINFEDHILPIFKNNCFDCHNPDKSKADYSLTTFEDAIKGGETGPAVVSKNPDESLLYRLIVRTEKPYMPRKEPKMDAEKIKLIRQWITQGLLKSSGAKMIKQKKSKITMAELKPSKGKPKKALALPKLINLEPLFKTKQTGQLLAQASSPWSPLVALSVGNQVLLYDINKILLRGVLKFPEGMAYQLRFSRDGKFLLGSGGVAGKKGIYVLWRVADGEIIREGGQEFDSILSGDVSPNLKFVSTGGSSKLVKIYDLSSGKIIHKLKKHNDWVLATEFSPDGVLLASADRVGGIVVWESGSGQEYCMLNGHKSAVNALSWRADSNFLVSGSEDGNIKIWSLHRRRQIKNWRGHNGGVLWVEYGKDGKIVSCGRDKLVKIWSKNGKLLKTIRHFKDLPLRVSFSTDRRFVIAGDFSGESVVFNAKSGKIRNKFDLTPPSIFEQQALNVKQVSNIQNRLSKKIGQLVKLQKSIGAVQKSIKTKKGELSTLKKTALVKKNGKANVDAATKQLTKKVVGLNSAELKKKNASLQKNIKEMTARLGPITKKRNDVSRSVKHLKNKHKTLVRQGHFWKSSIHINELNQMKKKIDGFQRQLKSMRGSIKNQEAQWPDLKKQEESLLLFQKAGQKQLNELRSRLKKENVVYAKELKSISALLKSRGQLNSEIYEAEFMEKELKVKASKSKSNSKKLKAASAKLKVLGGSIKKAKELLLKKQKNLAKKVTEISELEVRLTANPKELSKVRKEIKNISQQLSTPNPLMKSIPLSLKKDEVLYKALLIKFDSHYAKFLK